MIGNSIKCDVCNHIEPVGDLALFDRIDGWIRVTVTKPARYNWDRSRRSTFSYEADCCSISCARSILNEADDAVPANE